MASLFLLIKLMVTTLLVLVMTATTIVVSAGRYEFSSLKKAEVRMRLEQLNKPAVKSIESPDGDIIDCVHIAHQIAFDHPSLKNHTIQMRPSFDPDNFEEKPKSVVQLWHMNGECPENTVPIRRTKEEDLLKLDSLETFGKKSYNTIRQVVSSDLSASKHEYANVRVSSNNYYGSKSIINVWNPFVQQDNEFSLAQTWVGAGIGPDRNTIEAGWQIYPSKYTDYNTRLFIYWTGDDYKTTGCYNLDCSGFIQTDKTWVLGGTISPISVDGGTQHDITLLIWKDKTSGNWWLKIDGTNVGYWPNKLFTSLSNSATRVSWGGEIVNKETGGQHTTTNMGSGHFPREGYGKAAYFKNVEIVDGSNKFRPATGLSLIVTNPMCYDINVGATGTPMGTYFYYGGLGRNPNCP